jgi:uncharacterized repeat protein (TIGR03803 family)
VVGAAAVTMASITVPPDRMLRMPPPSQNYSGTQFVLTSDGSGGTEVTIASNSFTTLVSFNGANGLYPYAGLIADAAGDLFGTTVEGGANNDGTVFEIAKTGAGYASTTTILASFNGTDGLHPLTGLIADAAGDLFGTTEQGANGVGSVFEIAKTGDGYASTPITVASFNRANGLYPYDILIADASGDLFGTTLEGGPEDPVALHLYIRASAPRARV